MKTEACQSIQQMQMTENNLFDVDDPVDSLHGPIRLPFFKKGVRLVINIYYKLIYLQLFSDRIPRIKSENSLDYPFQKNVYPSLSELVASEALTILQVL